MRDFVKVNIPGSVLDVGCGTGEHLKALVNIVPFQSVGIDVSTKMLKIAIKKIRGKAQLVRASMYYLPFRSDSFDVAISLGPTVATKRPALEEIHRVSRNDGHLFMDFHNALSPFAWVYLLGSIFQNFSGSFALETPWSVRKIFISEGFAIVRWSSCMLTPVWSGPISERGWSPFRFLGALLLAEFRTLKGAEKPG